MKPLYLHDLQDVSSQSWVLHQAMLALGKSPLALSPDYFCQMFRLHRSELARMRWLHCRPHYRRFTSRKRLLQLLTFLFESFPTMLVARTTRGAVIVRVYKRYRGKRLMPTSAQLRSPGRVVLQAGRRGSTRWFLENHSVKTGD